MHDHAIEEVSTAASPFDDVFADDLFAQGEMVASFPIWTHCGRRIDLQARMLGWRPMALWQVIDDADATFQGDDNAGWELEESDRWREAPEV